MNKFFQGFKSTVFSAKGLGAAAGFLALMVVLHMIGWDPATAAQRIRSAQSSGS